MSPSKMDTAEEQRARGKVTVLQPTRWHGVQQILRGVRCGAFSLLALFAMSTAWAQLTFAPPTLPNGTVDTAYPTTIVSTAGGTSPFTFTLVPFFPPGLTFTANSPSPGSATISGTPTSAGTFTFDIVVVEGVGTITTNTQSYTVVIAGPPLAITPSALPNSTQGAAYTQTLTASGAPGPYSFALTAGGLPLGMSFNSAGVFSGTPTAAGTFNFTVTADNGAAGSTGSRAYSFVVDPPPCTGHYPFNPAQRHTGHGLYTNPHRQWRPRTL